MLQQYCFEFRGRDTEALVFDHLFFAIDDVNISLVIHPADVAGVEPSVAQGTRGLFRRVPVTFHYLRATHASLADLALRQIDFAGLEVYDPGFSVSQQGAAAFGFKAMRRGLMRGGTGFRQAVSLKDAKAESVFHAASYIRR